MNYSPLEVNLAGINVDIEHLRMGFFKRLAYVFGLGLRPTPETICAAYARISRSPNSIAELRKEARKYVEQSRKTNKVIIFTMGHKSIAEHGTFNIDVSGISRRAVEDLESKRLQSYTEKSQRYVTLDGDFIIPKEIQNNALEPMFIRLVEKQNKFYNQNLNKLIDWHFNQDYTQLFKALNIKSEEKDKQRNVIEGLGKEDARYALGMATQTQLGMTTSARNLEVLITRLRSSENKELIELGEKIFKEIDGEAPSVLKYISPTDYFAKTRKELKIGANNLIKLYPVLERERDINGKDKVKLFTQLKRDDSILAGILFSSSDTSYSAALDRIREMSGAEKNALKIKADEYQKSHDPKLREYELGDRVAEIVLSSSAFAQLKRHRMNTIISQDYNPALGFTIPKSISETGLEDEFKEVMKESHRTYNILKTWAPTEQIADYALTNAHKRRVLLDANNRQVHAICLERENLAAQWDIREITHEYHKQIQADSPITAADLCGKHEFYETKERMQQKLR